MLNNRFGRLLITLLIVALFFGVFFLLATTLGDKILPNVDKDEESFLNIPYMIMYMPLLCSAAICLVGQIFGDILNVKILFNNKLARLLKIVLFFAASGGLVMNGGYTMCGILIGFDEITFVERTIGILSLLAPAFAYWAYLIVYGTKNTLDYRSENKRSFPFIQLWSFVASLGLSVILAIVGKILIDQTLADKGIQFEEYSNKVIDIAYIVLLVIFCGGPVWCFFHKWPFAESEYAVMGGYGDSYTPSYSETRYYCKDCRHFATRRDKYGCYQHYCVRNGTEVWEAHGTCQGFSKKR
ncbi:MAG: hypothetical protein IKD26_02675 [Clostridia bacterium]|nr:hypothetical protein [Clostridia bacterium]